jgi:predicted Zn finger-like uncharacterized protein
LIVTCEQCATQFHLDDAKVPVGGVRVRCSRCKHAFFIEPKSPAPSLAGADRAAQEAAIEQAPPPPEPAEDLSPPADGGSADFEEADDATNESDWEFNQEPLGSDLSAEPDPVASDPLESEPAASAPIEAQDAAREAIDDLLGSRPAPGAARSAPAAEDEDLGSPESWDLLADDPPSAEDASEASESGGAPARRDPAVAARLAALAPPADEWTPPSEPSLILAWIARTGHVIGWSATAILFSMVALLTLAPSLAPEAEAPFGAQPIAGLEAQGISGRWVENAVAGSLLVVSGRIVNPTAAPAALGKPIGVRLLDGSGARLPVELAALGPLIHESELREANPASLQVRQAAGGLALAAATIQPGQSLPFEAVLSHVPLAASRFLLGPIAPGRGASLAAAGGVH